jgi:FtsZ-binding cell division protein ZapB
MEQAMTNKTVILSRGQLQRWEALLDSPVLRQELLGELHAALAEPVPPAGGEVEVLGYRWKTWQDGEPKVGRYVMSNGSEPDFVQQLVDIVHVTRLQAEVERLKEAKVLVEIAASQVVKAKESLQAELTKARELLTDICDTAYIQSSEGADAYGAAREYLAEQRGKS